MKLSLVTGATGFLGSRVAKLLVERGCRVRALVRRSSDRGRLEGLDLEYAEGDVTDRASIDRAIEGVDVVYHVAALYELGTADHGKMREINVGGTSHVLGAASARGVRAIHVSSVASLGPTGDRTADESHWTPDVPRSAYESTKREAHEVARQAIARGADVRIASPSTIYGPNDPSLVGRFHRLYADGWIRMGALREMTMSLVHVDDCAEGLLRVAERGRGGEEYILCAQAVTVGEWLEALARADGRRPPRLFVPDRLIRLAAPAAERLGPLFGVSRALLREGLAMSSGLQWRFSGARARTELGWSPRALEDGLAETLAWYNRTSARGRAVARA